MKAKGEQGETKEKAGWLLLILGPDWGVVWFANIFGKVMDMLRVEGPVVKVVVEVLEVMVVVKVVRVVKVVERLRVVVRLVSA